MFLFSNYHQGLLFKYLKPNVHMQYALLFSEILLEYSYSLTPNSRVLLEKLTGSQLVNKFPTFYGTLRFITVFTSARHLSVS